MKAGPPLVYSIKHVSFLIRHKGKNGKQHQRLNCLFAHLGKRQSESEWAALWKASVLSRNHMEVSHALFWASESHDKKRADEMWQLQGAIVIRSRLRVPLAALFRIALISAGLEAATGSTHRAAIHHRQLGVFAGPLKVALISAARANFSTTFSPPFLSILFESGPLWNSQIQQWPFQPDPPREGSMIVFWTSVKSWPWLRAFKGSGKHHFFFFF